MLPILLNFLFSFKQSKEGWSNGEQILKTGEDWIEFTRRKLLTLGIADALYELDEPDTANQECHRFNFYFKTELQCLQFQSAAAQNTQTDFLRSITSDTAKESLYQEQKISHFLEENGIAHAIHRENARTLTVTTSQREDDLILAMQILNRSFDMTSISRRSTSSPVLLTYRSNERV